MKGEMINIKKLRILWIVAIIASLIPLAGKARAEAKFAATAPTIDGIVSTGEWDFAETEFDTGPRPIVDNPGGWDNSGAKGTFAFDCTNVYGLIEAYPNTGTCGATNENGIFDNLNWEVFINAVGGTAAFLDTTFGDPNNVPGSTAAFGTIDPFCPGPARMVIEFSVPIASIVDGATTFDPSSDFLEYRLRTTDPDTAGGFDTRDQTLGWVIEPPETSGGFRRLNFGPAGVCFDTVGQCITTLIDENCSGLTGRNRAMCNHKQQDFCFDLFDKGKQ